MPETAERKKAKTMKAKKRNEAEIHNLRRDTFDDAILCRADDVPGEATDDGAVADNRRVTLSLSSEEPYQRWFGTEILSHDAEAIDLSRLEDGGVVLFNHNPDHVLGKILSVSLDEKARKLRAEIEFDTDQEADLIYKKVQSGTLKGVSVGYKVDVWEEVARDAKSEDGRFVGPCDIATRWTPYEISIVSVPADNSVGIGRMYELGGDGTMENTPKEPETMQKDAAGIETKEEQDKAVRAAMLDERKRVQEIGDMCRQFGVEADKFIADGTSVDAARAAVMEKLAQERTAQDVTVQADEADKFRAAAVDGLSLRAGMQVERPADGADEFRGMSLVRLASEVLSMEGKSVRHMDDMLIMREALTGTGAFPGILSNVANKSLAQAYQLAPTTFQDWTAKGSNKDFKTATRYRLSEAPSLEKINENGEFKHAALTEDGVTTKIESYGATFSITMQALINDDLGALSRQPTEFGIAARRDINERVYAVLSNNESFQGTPLFDKKHGNVQSAALDVAGLGVMKAAMARQTNIAGKQKLNIQPAFLIVPPELEVQAAQLIHSVVDPSKNNAAVNPFANKLTVISDPELVDTKTFYMVAAPGYVPTIEVTYLNGQETPTIESSIQFDTLGMKWRIYQHVGVNLVDYRGIQKSTIA